MTCLGDPKKEAPGRGNGKGAYYQTAQQPHDTPLRAALPITSAADVIRAFSDYLIATGMGLPRDGIQADGQLHRYCGQGDKPGYRNAWYVLHVDGRPAGAFGNWRTQLHRTWRANGGPLDSEEEKALAVAMRRAQMRARTARMELHAEAARSALSFWRQSGGASLGHPYLRRKAVPPLALRQSGALLLVPLFDVAGELWNLQTIAPDGTKRFQKGARVGGLFSPIGEVGENPHCLLICEGWATGATLHVETGNPVFCAMNCGNLRAVALAARERWPHADIVVCGDDDWHTEGNPGRTKAIEAAAVIGGRVSFPRFAPGDDGTDFNDMAQPGRGVSA